MLNKNESYNNLIDVCIELEENPDFVGKPGDMFKKLLIDYFFKYETDESKSMEAYFIDYNAPSMFNSINSLFDIDIESLTNYVNGSMINDSLSGQIMLSKNYLKSFYPESPPSFSKLHEDVKFELIDKVKEKNEKIISAYEKMLMDRDADKKRKVVTLVALILRNLYKKSARPLNKLNKSAEEIIRSTFIDCDGVFKAEQKHMGELTDDSKVKELIKTFFIIKRFDEITEISNMFNSELERFKKRALRANV